MSPENNSDNRTVQGNSTPVYDSSSNSLDGSEAGIEAPNQNQALEEMLLASKRGGVLDFFSRHLKLFITGILLLLVIISAVLFGLYRSAENRLAGEQTTVNGSAAQLKAVNLPEAGETDYVLTVNGELQVSGVTRLTTLDVAGTANFAQQLTANTIQAGNFRGNGAGLTAVDALSLGGRSLQSILDEIQSRTTGNASQQDLQAIRGQLSDVQAQLNDVASLSGNNTFSGANIFNNGLTVQGSLSGQSAIFSNNVAALSFTQNGNAVCDISGNCNVGAGISFVQNGNAFGAAAVLGTTDNFGLTLRTANQDRLTIAANGAVSVAGALSAGSLSGNGAALNNLNAANLATGTIGDQRLSTNVTLQGNTFNGLNQLVQLTAAGALPALNGSNLSNVNAAALQGYAASYFTNATNLATGTLADQRLSSNVPLKNVSNTFTADNYFANVSALNLLQNGNQVCDISGNCVGQDGSLTGSGSSGRIALFTAANTLADSIISQASTTITVAGTLSAVALQGDGSLVTNLNASNITSGTLTVANGGTGATSFTANGVLYGNGNGGLLATAAGVDDQCLVGTTGGAPRYVSCDLAASGSQPGGIAGGDLDGLYPNPTVVGLSGTALSVSNLTTGNVLLYDGTTWSNTVLSGDVSVTGSGLVTIANGAVSNSKLANSSLSVIAGNGLSGGGSIALGGSATLEVVYGTTATSAVAGNTVLFCPAGAGNLTGGGTTITLGSGGSCGNLNVIANPAFTSLTLSNALGVASGGTGATTAATARTNLGAAASGANSDITSLAAATSVGANTQALTLQGNASTVLKASNSGFTTSVGFAAPTSNVSYLFQSATAGSYEICTSAGNCIDDNGSVSSDGGTAGTIAVFTGTNTIANSLLSQAGSTVTVAGTLSASALQGSGADITNLNGSNISSGTVGVSVGGTGQGSFTSNGIIYGNGSGALGVTMAGLTGDCLVATTGGSPYWAPCKDAASGATPGGSVGGDLDGSYTNPRVVGIYGVPLSISNLSSPNILIYNGSNWVNAAVSGDLAISASGVATIADGVVSNGKLQNSALTVTAGTGLGGGGSVSLGGVTSLNVTYGALAGTAVEGNTTLTCAAGTGNLTGGGTVLTLGADGVCGTLNVVADPSFNSLSLTNALTIANGGTGAIDAVGARTNLSAAASGANGDITSLTAITSIDNSAALSIGTIGQALTLQGNASTVFRAIDNGFTTTLSFATPTANVTYRLPTGAAGSYDLCSTAGNCAGAGAGVTSAGGTVNTIALFTGSQAIGDSLLSQSGSTITVGGALAVADSIATNGTVRLTSAGVLQNVTANADIIASGTVNDARLSSNVALLSGAQTFTGTKTFGAITNFSDQINSTLANGTAPLTVVSSTKVTNFNADLLDGLDSTAFAQASGSTNYIQNTTTQQASSNFNISGNGVIGGNLTVSGDVVGGGQYTRQMTRSIPTTINDAVDIGSFTFTNGGANLQILITVPSSGYSDTKQYALPIKFNATSNTWRIAKATTETGGYLGNDYELDINVSGFMASLRLRRTAGTTVGTAYITIIQQGITSNVFTASTTTASVTAPTVYYAAAVLSQANGGVVIQGSLNVANSGTIATNGVTRIDATGNATFAGLTASGNATVQGSGGLLLGVGGTTAGKLTLYNASNANAVTIQSAVQNNALTLTIPTSANSTDTFCLVSLQNCTGGASGAVTTVGALDGGTANASGATISTNTIFLQSASASFAGLVNTGSQVFAGAKTFSGNAGFGGTLTVTGATTLNSTLAVNAPVTITTSNGGASFNSQGIFLTNTNTSATNNTLNGQFISLTGTANSNATNTNNATVYASVSPQAGNVFNALRFGTGYNSLFNYNGNSLISGTGLLQNAALDSTLNYSNLQNVTNLTASGAVNVSGLTTLGSRLTVNASVRINSTTSTDFDSQAIYLNNTNTSATSNFINGQFIALSASANSNATNFNNGITLASVTPTTGNNFTALRVGTGFNGILQYDASVLISGLGKLQNAALDSTLNYSNLQNVTNLTVSGALGVTAGSGAVGLIVKGNGTQGIVDFQDQTGGSRFAISNGGYVTANGGFLSSLSSSNSFQANQFQAALTNTSSTVKFGQAQTITLTGTANSNIGANNLIGTNYQSVNPIANNIFYAQTFGTGYNSLLRYGSTDIINGVGMLQNGALDSSLIYSNLQNVTNLTVGGTLTVTGAATFNGTLTAKSATFTGTLTINGHIISGNTSGNTTVVAGDAAACGDTATVSITGNDTAGKVTITTGSTGCSIAGSLADITFASAYATTPFITLTPANSMASTLVPYYSASTTSFSISRRAAPVAATTYEYSYHVFQ